MSMSLNDYQDFARKTAIYTDGIFYPVLGLCGESGEVADKIKKIYRDKEGKISEEDKTEIVRELGDVLWYLANMAADLGVSLEIVAQSNLEKTNLREKLDRIHGAGDNRELQQ